MEQSRVLQAFQHWDSDGDRRIFKSQLSKVLVDLGLDRSSIDRIVEAANADEDGCVDYEEFVVWVFDALGDVSKPDESGCIAATVTGPTAEASEVRKRDSLSAVPSPDSAAVFLAFQKWDTDGDAQISPAQLRRVLLDLGLKASRINQIFAAVDTNKDGHIDYGEFITWLFGGAGLGPASDSSDVIDAPTELDFSALPGGARAMWKRDDEDEDEDEDNKDV